MLLVVYRLGTYRADAGDRPDRLAASIFAKPVKAVCWASMNMFAGGAVERMGDLRPERDAVHYRLHHHPADDGHGLSDALKSLKKEGEAGRKQINQYTRYLTRGIWHWFRPSRSRPACKRMSDDQRDIAINPGPFFVATTGVVTLVGRHDAAAVDG
jgi:preprotein translocase subunit SecY